MGKAREWLSDAERRAIAEELLTVVRADGDRLWAHCPFHSEGTPGNSFYYNAVDDVAHCYSCDQTGDLISVFNVICGRDMTDGDGFKEFRSKYAPAAIEGRPSRHMPQVRQEKAAWAPKQVSEPSPLWQDKAGQWVGKCADRLQSTPAALSSLAAWGITSETARKCRIGWNEQDKYPTRASWGLPEKAGKEKVWLPGPALVFPFFHEGRLQKAKVRRDHPEKGPEQVAHLKYLQIDNGDVEDRFTVYGKRARVVILVETERDGALLWQEGREWNVTAIATGGATKKPDEYAAGILRDADVVLNALDSDEAGAKAAWSWWANEFPNQVRWPVPKSLGKDIGDAVIAGLTVKDWIEAGIPSHVTFLIQRDARRSGQRASDQKQSLPEAPHPATVPPGDSGDKIVSESPKAKPAPPEKLVELLRRCPYGHVYAVAAGEVGIGARGCEPCKRFNQYYRIGCPLWVEIGILMNSSDECLEYVDGRGGTFKLEDLR